MRSPLVAGLAVAAAFTCAAPAQAAITSDVVGASVNVQSDSAGDTLFVSAQGNFLTHNNLGAGYASATDWNSDPAVNEPVTRDFSYTFNYNGGAGADNLLIGSDTVSAADIKLGWNLDGGGGLDALFVSSEADSSGRAVNIKGDFISTDLVYPSTGVSITSDDFDGGFLAFTGSGQDVVTVGGAHTGRPIGIETGAADDTVTVGGPGSGLNGLKGTVYVDGEAGTDTLKLDDAASTGGMTYSFDPSDFHRGEGDVRIQPATEKVSLLAGSGNDSIYKSSGRQVSIFGGGGDDLIASRDSVGDPVNCGAGSDYVLTDASDAPDASCEATDRVTPAPAGGTGTSPADGGTSDQPQSPQGPPTPPADTTAPVVTVSGLAKSYTVKKLLGGLKARVATDEAASVDVQLVGSTSTARLARAYNLTLGQAKLPLGSGERALKVKPNKRLVGKARRFTVRVLITATDASGNRSTVTKTLKVKR